MNLGKLTFETNLIVLEIITKMLLVNIATRWRSSIPDQESAYYNPDLEATQFHVLARVCVRACVRVCVCVCVCVCV